MSNSTQFHTPFNTRFSEVVGLLEEVVLQSTPKLSFGDGGRAQMFWKTVTRAATMKPLCGVPLLFSARPDLHVPQNRDRLGQRDSPSACRRAANMQDQDLGYS